MLLAKLLVASVMQLFRTVSFELMGSEPEVIELGLSYTNIIFGGSFIFIILVEIGRAHV